MGAGGSVGTVGQGAQGDGPRHTGQLGRRADGTVRRAKETGREGGARTRAVGTSGRMAGGYGGREGEARLSGASQVRRLGLAAQSRGARFGGPLGGQLTRTGARPREH